MADDIDFSFQDYIWDAAVLHYQQAYTANRDYFFHTDRGYLIALYEIASYIGEDELAGKIRKLIDRINDVWPRDNEFMDVLKHGFKRKGK